MSLSQEIESKIAILDVVNRYVQTKKAGVNYKALCPFHHEKTASFVISPAKNIAKCFSCGKWGGPIRFLMEIENIEFREAAGILAKEAGIEFRASASRPVEKWKDIYLAYRLATEWYHNQIFRPEGKKALDYLLNRGISEKTIRDFGLGYSHSPMELLKFLQKNDFETAFLIESGLFVNAHRDKFFGRVIFPIANIMGNTVAFTGRILDVWEPKYLNSPVSKIFDKSSILYGLHLAKQTIMKTGEVLIVEWQMDTIALHQAGITNAVGISGTALTSDHIRILKRFTKIVYLTLDADSAGIKATFLSINNLLNSDLEIRIILIPNGKDPDEFLRSGGDFEVLKKNSLSVIDYYIAMGEHEYNINTLIWQKQLLEKCMELIAKIISPIEVDFYVKNLAKSFDVSRDALYETLYAQKRKHQQEQKNIKKDDLQAFFPNVFDLLAGYIEKFWLLDLFFEKFAYTIQDIEKISGSAILQNIVRNTPLSDEQQEMLATIEVYIDETIPDKHADIISRHFLDLIRQLHIALLEVEKNTLLSEISVDSPEYLQAYTELIRKAQKLSIPTNKISL